MWSDSKVKEQPVKEDDHGADLLRYASVYLARDNKLAFAISSW